MKKTLKSTLPLLLILCISALLMLTSCGGSEVTEAYITNSNLPRTTYVEGQELDLSTGYLTVVRGKEESNIPFSAEGIVVSGYDSNTLGEQTVTVSYGEAVTTFTVKVVPRIIAENFETKYFVGDSFNYSAGRIKVATDDGKTTNVNFNDSKVSVSFDSATAGKKTVTVTYTNGSTSYDYSFEITVYEASNVEYTPPKKTDYLSHINKIEDKDVKDGFFNVTSSDGKLTKVVPVTAAMVKGYDPSAATIENRENALVQALTIEYLGNTYDYSINIYFSDVSVVNYYANGTLKDLNLSGKLTAAQNNAAFEAISSLLKLSSSDKALISSNAINTVVAAAAVGVTDLFMTELNTCRFAFSMNELGEVGLVGASYEATKEALDKLTDPASDLNAYVGILRTLISDDYKSVSVTSSEKVSDIVIVYSKDMENLLLPVLDHLVTVHEILSDIPRNWTNETLKDYGTDILDAVIEIKKSEFYRKGFGTFYTQVLSKWRAENDLLELIYSYFLYVYDGSEDYMQNNLFGYFPMPGMLEELYEQLMTTYNMQVTYYQNQQGDMWLADLSRYATSYFLTLDYAEAVKTSGNTLWVDLYNAYTMDYVIASYTSAQNFGFQYHAGAMIDSDNFKLIWQQYYMVLQLYLTNKLDAAEHESLVFAMFDTFQSMTPGEVFGFLSSLNLCYGSARGSAPVLYLDFEEHLEANIFATVLREYYCTYLTEANVSIFADLLLAIESAALFGENDEALVNFVGFMELVNDAYSKLTNEADKENFEKYLGKSYSKYLDIYKRILGEYEEKPTDDELALIAQLREDLARYEEIYLHIMSLPQSAIKNSHYFLLYSAYAKATTTYNAIVKNASKAALTVLYTEGFVFFDGSNTVGKTYYLIDRETTLMLQSTAAVEKDGKIIPVSHWSALNEYGLLEIYVEMGDLLYFVLVDKTAVPDAAKLNALSAKIAALDDFSAKLFMLFGADSAYYSAKCSYLEVALKDDAAAQSVATALSEASALFEDYCAYPTIEIYKTDFLEAMEKITAAYKALSDEQKKALSEVYDFYFEAYEELSSQEQEMN